MPRLTLIGGEREIFLCHVWEADLNGGHGLGGALGVVLAVRGEQWSLALSGLRGGLWTVSKIDTLACARLAFRGSSWW